MVAVGGVLSTMCGGVGPLGRVSLVVQPSLTIVTHHNRFMGSRHPRMIVSALWATSHPVRWKKTLQPASHRTTTDSRLLVSLGRQCTSLAWGGSFLRRRSTAWEVVILSPPGYTMEILTLALVVVAALVDGMSNMMEAAVSIKAVLDKLGGLVQPDWSITEFALLLIATE